MTRPEVESALRWVAVAHIDGNVCKPCKDNDGKLYRNRQAAYRDYPNGKSYVKCVGAEFGNDCRCKVVKRSARNEGEGSMELGEIVNRYRSLTARMTHAVDSGAPASQPRPVDLRLRPATGPQNAAGAAPATPAAPAGADLYIYDPIGGWCGIEPIDVVRALAEVSGPLTVHFNSPGGSIFDGAAIYDAIASYANSKGVVTSRIEGNAASAASFIALAASPYDEATGTGGVHTTELGTMMIHDGAISGVWGATQDDLMELADLVGMLSDNIAGVYARKTGGTAAEWRDIMREGDTWYNAAQQIEAKLADRMAAPGTTSPAPEPPAEPAPEPEPPVPPVPGPGPDNTAPVDYEGLRLALKGALA